MATVQPYKGANTAQFYIEETIPGTTPANPSWKPLRNTGGIPAITRDSLVSNELDGSRETSSIRTGNKQVTGEFAIELSQQSQDDLLAGAMTSQWVAGFAGTGVSVAVNSTTKVFTRSAGNFLTDGVEVGDLIAFTDLSGGNGKPFVVTSVNDTTVAGAAIPDGVLTTAAAATTDYATGDKLETGNLCKTYSILTIFHGKCGTVDGYLITRGVEFSGFSIEMAVNAEVTGSFPMIGLNQERLTAVPAGSTFTVDFNAEPFASVDVSAFQGTSQLKLIDTFTITNDNGTSAQFELGNDSVAFVERGRAANTFSLAGKLYSLDQLDPFLNETQVELTAILSGQSGAMSFTLKKAEITAATPEIGGPESITLTMEGQATGNQFSSSIVIQRIAYA